LSKNTKKALLTIASCIPAAFPFQYKAEGNIDSWTDKIKAPKMLFQSP